MLRSPSVPLRRGLSGYSVDYCFAGDEFVLRLTVLVVRERCTGIVMATTGLVKGSTGKFAVDKVLEWMDEVKRDGGPFDDVLFTREMNKSHIIEKAMREEVVKGRYV